MTPVSERFWRYVVKTSGCWLWIGNTDGKYGKTRTGGRGSPDIKAHRLSFLLAGGQIPAGREIDHLCRVKLCVNPSHLEVVTHAENMQRWRDASGYRTPTKERCKRGHPFTKENSAERVDGRRCRTCRQAAERARRTAARMREPETLWGKEGTAA